MKAEIIKKNKKGQVYKYTYTKGPDIGDYFFVALNAKGDFISRFGNRSFREALKAI